MKTLAHHLDTALAGILTERKGLSHLLTLTRAWHTIAPANLASACAPHALTSRTLTVRCQPEAALLLQHAAHTILTRARLHLGRTHLDHLRILQQPHLAS